MTSVVPPRAATESEILGFHSADYIDFLKDVSTVSDVEENTEDPNKLYAEAEAYGLCKISVSPLQFFFLLIFLILLLNLLVLKQIRFEKKREGGNTCNAAV